MAQPILEVINLVKSYGNFRAVDGISFRVKEGEIVGLLGPNGAGKTTTLSMILGILTPTSGSITVFGKDLATHRSEIAKQFNYSSAYTRAPWRLRVWEHLYVFALLYEVDHPMDRVNVMIKVFDLEKYRNNMTGDLSAGNLAKVNLAKAFMNSPKLVLLDEPTSSLDPDIADHVRKFLLEAQEKYKTTVVITSHNMAEIDELCDRVIFVNHGKIIEEGTPEELAKKLDIVKVRLRMTDGQKRTIEYCKAHRLPHQASERHVVIDAKEAGVAKLLTDLAAKGVTYSEITIEKPTLEQYFIGEVRK